MWTLDDIQIFIITHNRAAYLPASVRSVLSQTAGKPNLTILDNDSTDNTTAVAASFAGEGVRYQRTSGFLGNFNKAKKLLNRPYCMLFHDDDLLHPQWLEMVLKALNQVPNVSLVTCSYQDFQDGQTPPFSPHPSARHFIFETMPAWAEYMYMVEGISYAPAVYRSEDLLAESLEYERFNKFNDWPLMCKMARSGTVVFYPDTQYMLVRRHSGQDGATMNNFPSLQQMVNWDAFFFEAMGRPGLFHSLYWISGLRMRHFLLGKYLNACPESYRQEHSLEEVKTLAKKAGLPVWGFPKKPFFRFLIHPLSSHRQRALLARCNNAWDCVSKE